MPEIPVGAISKIGTYSSAETWNLFRKKKNNVIWWPLVWHKYAIPKQAFILWLAKHNRLNTGDCMLTWSFKGDTLCVFCRGSIERRNHLLFSCGFSSRIWKSCMQMCNILNSPTSWDDMVSVGSTDWQEKTLLGTIYRLILSSTVYGIWRERNEIKFGGQPKTKEQILKFIF